jgi:hypothetical protein
MNLIINYIANLSLVAKRGICRIAALLFFFFLFAVAVIPAKSGNSLALKRNRRHPRERSDEGPQSGSKR